MDADHDLTEIWQRAREVLAADAPVTRREWVTLTEPVGFGDDMIVLGAPHAMARSWLTGELAGALERAVNDLAERPVQVLVVQKGDTAGSPAPSATTPPFPAASPAPPPANGLRGPEPPWSDVAEEDRSWPDRVEPLREPEVLDLTDGSGLHAPGRPAGPTAALPPPRPAALDDAGAGPSRLNPKYSFENFVVGSSNRLARAAAFAVAEAPAHAYNPLFIYGDSGLGKTHLLHAVGHYVRTLFPRMRVCYVTTEQFTNEFISAIQSRETSAFHGRYRQMDVLLIDDIQFLERAERTQEEFFHTFNHLHGAEKQLVICSDRPPSKLAQLDSRLRSRFEWGLLTDVQPPELETRIAILRKQVEREGLQISRDVLEYIASRVSSNVRALEGALLRVTAYASLHGRGEITLDVAASVLKDVLPADHERRITCGMIMEIVATYFELTVADLQSRSKQKHLVIARHIAMYLAREMTDLSLPKIGEEFGGRDHTTVINAKDKIALKLKEDQSLFDQVTLLEQRITGGHA